MDVAGGRDPRHGHPPNLLVLPEPDGLGLEAAALGEFRPAPLLPLLLEHAKLRRLLLPRGGGLRFTQV
jgi:hypothetical protein